MACTRAVVTQAMHVAERGKHHLSHSMLTPTNKVWQKHAFSKTHGGANTTLVINAGYTGRICAWAG